MVSINLGLQNEITMSGPLLSNKGILNQRGWARKPLLTYNKENIGKSWLRIKEWDHYSILNPEFGIQLTIGDIGYLTQMSFVFLDFKKRKRFDYATMKFLTKSKLLPQSSSEDSTVEFPTKKFYAKIEKRGNIRQLKFDNIQISKEFVQGNVKLMDDPSMDNAIVATGYKEDSKLFYYNHKINYMPAEGQVNFGGKEFIFRVLHLDHGRARLRMLPILGETAIGEGFGVVLGDLIDIGAVLPGEG